MKRFLTIAVLTFLLASTTGCRNCSWFRGTFLNPDPEPVCCDPCAPLAAVQPSACAPCGGVPAGTTVVPAPGAYAPSTQIP